MSEARTAADYRAQAQHALQTLIEGNRRFANGEPRPHIVSPQDREAMLESQEPIATILGCVDSRVTPEIVTDQGLGDLLTVRSAGQALTGVALGSIEFGARALGLPLVVVMGHTGCGAVLAALSDHKPDGHLGDLAGEVASRLVEVVGHDPVRATGANLKATVAALREMDTLVSPDGHHSFIVGALYDMAIGSIEITDDAGLL